MPESLGYMTAPFTACLFLTGILCYLGIHVIEREVIFVDLALAQIAALGTTFAFLLGYDLNGKEAYGLSLMFTFLGAGIFSITRPKNVRVHQEAIIGIVYVVTSAAAILIVDKIPHGAEHIKYILVGSIVWVNWPMIIKTAIIYALIGIFHIIFRKRFLLVSLMPGEALKEGISLKFWDFLFYVSFGLAITIAVSMAGILLVFSYLIVPATFATLFSKGVMKRLIIGWALGVMVSFFGLLLSYDRPTGPTIVCLFGLALVLAWIYKLCFSSTSSVR